jgi:nitrite reductase/ring-hydroxylating ferredoxin subunit
MALHDVGAVADLDKGPLVVAVGDVDLIVWRVGPAIRATDRWCPHARGDLGAATLSGTHITCGDHGWDFDILTGACVKQPGRFVLTTYPCHVRGGRIEVELPDGSP